MVPARFFQVTMLSFNPKAYKVDFYNPYVQELKLTVSADSIEYTIDLLSDLGAALPCVHSVHLQFVCYGRPKRRSILKDFQTTELKEFVSTLKKEEFDVDEFCRVMDAHIFKRYPKVQFRADIIFCEDTPMGNAIVGF
jgi:hypothetical protein